MGTTVEIIPGTYAQPTPAGAHAAVTGGTGGPTRDLLLGLLSQPASTPLHPAVIQRWTGAPTEDAGLETVLASQDAGLVEGIDHPTAPRSGTVEQVLRQLLPSLSSSGTAMLVDAHGFVAGASGFDDETAELFAALSADLGMLHERHRAHFADGMGLPTSAWALVDGAGNSQVGFWPLEIGAGRFVLTVRGVPRLNSPAFTELIWALHLRYGVAAEVTLPTSPGQAPQPTP